MGNPIPIEPPFIDPAKYYWCTIAWYWGNGTGCSWYGGEWSCGAPGTALLYWLPFECVEGYGLCAQYGWAAQKLLCAVEV